MKAKMMSNGTITRTSGKLDTKTLKVCRDNWICLGAEEIISHQGWSNASEASIEIFTRRMGSLTSDDYRIYLKDVLTYDINKQELVQSKTEPEEDTITHYHTKFLNAFRRMIKHDKLGGFRIRLESDDTIIHITSSKYSKESNTCCLDYIEFDLKEEIVIGRNIVLRLSELDIPLLGGGRVYFNESWTTQYCGGLSLSKVINYGDKHKMYQSYSEKLRLMKIITFAFKSYMDTDNFNEHFVFPDHREFELKMISKSMRELVGDKSLMLQLNRWVMHENMTDVVDNNYGDKCMGHIDYLLGNYISIPLVDLNDKEFNFINNFIKENGYDVAEGKTINLNEFLTHSRYGRSLRWYKTSVDGDEDTVAISYELDSENDSITFYVGHFSDRNILVETVEFINISNFNLTDNISTVGVVLYHELSNHNLLPNSPQLIAAQHNIDIDNYKIAISAVWDTIKVHIVSFLRPERTKILRITEKNTSKNMKGPNKPKHESDIIIRRILKTTYEAKKYIKKTAANNSDDIIREYTIEEWPRMGHWRKTKSGPIWIEPTTCHRNANLLGTEKEIHIKL